MATKISTPRYTAGGSIQNIPTPGENSEHDWVIFVLAIFVLLGIAFISAFTYVVLLG